MSALVVCEEQRSANAVGEGLQLLLAKQVLKEREDALARCRVRREGESDTRRLAYIRG